MNSTGIRILDNKGNILEPELTNILDEIPNGNDFFWSILYLYAIGQLENNKSMPGFESEINESEKGLFISWDQLNALSKKFYQIIDIHIIGSKNKYFLKRYAKDQEEYNSCDIIIKLIDSGFWELYSKDEILIKKLIKKFKYTELFSHFDAAGVPHFYKH